MSDERRNARFERRVGVYLHEFIENKIINRKKENVIPPINVFPYRIHRNFIILSLNYGEIYVGPCSTDNNFSLSVEYNTFEMPIRLVNNICF